MQKTLIRTYKTDDEYDLEIERVACDLIERYGAKAASFARNRASLKATPDLRNWHDIADAIQRIVTV